MTAVETSQQSRDRATAATAGSIVIAAVALVAGDAAMAAVAGAARAVVDSLVGAWLLATLVNAAASYVLVGIPQIKLGRRQTAGDIDGDRRKRWAIRKLRGGGPAAFVIASVVAGPIGVGWFTGRQHDPAAYQRTALASTLSAAAWGCLYFGLLEAIF